MSKLNKKTTLTFHSGILTIGGTIIEVAYEDSHIFFDFGSEYNPAATVQPTDLQGLLDAKLVPYVNNLFDSTIPLDGYVSQPDSFKHTAVFLSHMHLDHSKIINYLNPSVPLYTLEPTKSLLNTLNINNDFIFPKYNPDGKPTRDIIGVKENTVVQIGDIKVTVMPVDHDAYGACGLRIETPDLTVAYTGDLRIHGYRQEATLDFCQANQNCDVLLIEGVSVSFKELTDPKCFDEMMTEQQLIEQVQAIIETNKAKQLTFNYYISNIERIQQFIKHSSRQVVLDAYYSYVLKEATGYQSYYYSLDETSYGLDEACEISFDDLLADESQYFFQLADQALNHVHELKEGGIYIHSNAVPLIEADPLYKPFVEQFKAAGVTMMKLSCSGHAHPQDLMKIIDLIQPKLLVPIHSLRPEKLTNKHGDRLLPVKGQTI